MKRKLILIAISIMSVTASILGIASTYLSGLFLDRLIEARHISDMSTTLLLFFAITILGVIFRFTYSLIITPTKERFVYDFKITVLYNKKVPKQKDITYLSKRIDEDTRQMTNFFIDNYSTAIIKAVEIIIVSSLVFSIDSSIGLLMIVICPIYFGLYKLFKNPLFNKSLQIREKSARFFGEYTNELQSDFEGREDFIKQRFLSYLKHYREYILVNNLLNSSQALIIVLFQILVFVVGSISVINGQTTIGLLSILMMYFNQVIGNISYYLNLGRKWQVTNASICRIDEIINFCNHPLS